MPEIKENWSHTNKKRVPCPVCKGECVVSRALYRSDDSFHYDCNDCDGLGLVIEETTQTSITITYKNPQRNVYHQFINSITRKITEEDTPAKLYNNYRPGPFKDRIGEFDDGDLVPGHIARR